MSVSIQAWMSRRLSHGLPLDKIAEKACIAAAAVEYEFEGDVWLRLEELLVGERFTGFACVEYENGHTLGLAVVDGVVFGAYLEDPGGAPSWGEAALGEAEALWGPALVRLAPRSIAELEEYA
ncbi:hypothetical protein [Pyrodictium delaneyi]|uniref:Uncharacterized protein n=1 Tax=Pyrodictium delaneyi TaxID=1273541 RepID=A0A211YPR9_9CREN|nr:hypothetical protein [Pyrodictium delaneyi]OWJ54961.1 hypothetical protein Pdsh_04510 [Pyrodictium delaneyi]